MKKKKQPDVINIITMSIEDFIKTNKQYFPSLFAHYDDKDFFKEFDLDSTKDAIYYIKEKE